MRTVTATDCAAALARALALLLMVSAPLQATAAEPGIWSVITGGAPLAPGDTLAGEFTTASGDTTALPEGRYLLWLVDGAWALETRARVPGEAFNIPGETLSNPLLASLPLLADVGEMYVLFYAFHGLLPLPGERAQVQARLGALPALFDDDEAVPTTYRTPQGLLARAGVSGLLFMEGREIRYRFPNTWQAALTPVVVEAAARFLAGEAPSAYPLPAREGTRIPETLLSVQAPTLLVRVAAEAAEAPDDALRVVMEETAQGGLSARVESDHPGAVSRFLLEQLSPLLAAFAVEGVALVSGDAASLEALARAFPEWRFQAVDTPEAQLAWSNVSALAISADGVIAAPLSLPVSELSELTALETALRRIAP